MLKAVDRICSGEERVAERREQSGLLPGFGQSQQRPGIFFNRAGVDIRNSRVSGEEMKCSAWVLLNLRLFHFIFWLYCRTCRILALRSGMETGPSAVGVPGSNHWTTRRFPKGVLPFFPLSFLVSFFFLAYRKVQTPNHYATREFLEVFLNTYGEMSSEELDQGGRSQGESWGSGHLFGCQQSLVAVKSG